MALIDLASWRPKSNEFVLSYRYPETNLSTNTQLIVHESQEAFFFSKGQLMGKFGPGKHTLSTENLPLLRNLFGIPFGGKNPFTAEVWIVNKLMPTNLTWSSGKMSIQDVDYQTQLPLVASGQYGIQLVDGERFLINMVGTKDVFSEHDLASHVQGEFSTKVKSAVLQFMIQNNVGFKRISAYLDQLSEYLKQQVSGYWSQYGLNLTKFYVSSIDIDTSDANGRRVSEAIAQQSSMSITGHTWQQEQAFNMANNAVDGMTNNMNGGGLLGGLAAMSMLGGMGGGGMMSGGMMNPAYNQPTFGGNGQQPTMPQGGGMAMPGANMSAGAARLIYCANCSKKRSTAERFCPNCGSEYHPCPRCGADNNPNARRCVSCGQSLQGAMASGGSAPVCMSCGTPLAPGSKFCPNCGTPCGATDSDACPRCGNKMGAAAKFCPICGYKRG